MLRPRQTKHFDSNDAFAKDARRWSRQEKRATQRVEKALLTLLAAIFQDVYDALSQLRANVLVVHEAPSIHPSSFDAIDLLAQSVGVKTVFDGLHNDRLDF